MPQSIQTGTVKALIHWAYAICSTRQLFDKRIHTIKQALINNGYSNSMFDVILNTYLEKRIRANSNAIDSHTYHSVYYRKTISAQYKTDEIIIRNTIHKIITCRNKDDKLKVIIYYPSNTIAGLVTRNNQSPKPHPLKQT